MSQGLPTRAHRVSPPPRPAREGEIAGGLFLTGVRLALAYLASVWLGWLPDR
jgi:hypothetical protein